MNDVRRCLVLHVARLLSYAEHVPGELTSSTLTASRAFEPAGSQIFCGNEPNMPTKKLSTGTDVFTST